MSPTSRRALVLTLALGAASCAPAGESTPVAGPWGFHWGDLEAGSLGAATFEPIEALRAPVGREPDGLGWFRIPVPDSATRDPAVLFGGVTGAFEAFIDGQRVYGSGLVRPGGVERIDTTAWHLVPVPADRRGRIIFLRVQSKATGIGPAREVVLGERAELQARILTRGLLPLLVGILLLVGGLVGVSAYFWRRDNVSLVGLGVYSLVSGLLITLVSEATSLFIRDRRLAYDVMQSTIAWSSTAFLFAATTNVAAMRTPLFQFGLKATAGLAMAATVVQFGQLDWAMAIQQLALVAALGAIAAAQVKLVISAVQGDLEARILTGGFAVLLLTGVFDSLPSFGVGTPNDILLTPFGFLAVVAAFAALAVRRAGALADELQQRTEHLDRQRGEALALLARLGAGTHELALIVDDLRKTSRAQNEGVSRQAAALQETQVTAEEIRRTSATAAEQAQRLLEAAATVEQVGKAGEAAVSNSLAGLEAIGAEVHEMSRRIGAAGSRAREIAGIVGTVKDLADQSNMLALNAAIEAVRSGEHGKGFALVAREVRRLADESVRATVQIKQVLDGLSESVGEAVNISARGEQRVNESLSNMRESGDTIRQIGGIASETSRSVRQISAAVTQQNAGVSQIFVAIEDLGRQMTETQDRARETEGAAGRVQEAVARMTAGALVESAGPLPLEMPLSLHQA